MPRETAEAKGRRYITQARLTIREVHGRQVIAACKGQGQTYTLGHDHRRGWWCNCPCLTGNCSHLHALRLVIDLTKGPFTR